MSYINHRRIVYPIENSSYQVENGCEMGNPPTEEVKIKIQEIGSSKEPSFLDNILELFEKED